MIRNLTGLWTHRGHGKSGNYLSGRITEDIFIPKGSRVGVLKNVFKKENKHSDYKLVVFEDDFTIEGGKKDEDFGSIGKSGEVSGEELPGTSAS